MPNGVGQGIATGLTNAISLALQSKGLDLREERAKALTDIGERRLDISERELALKEGEFRPSIPQQQQEFEAEQEATQLANAKAKREQEEALIQAEKEKPTLDAVGYLNKTVGDERTPEQERLLQQYIDVKLIHEKFGGLVPEASIDKLLQDALDVENEDTSGTDFMIRFQNAGVTEALNEAEVREQQFEKLVKKDPLLGTNPQALKANPEAAELAQSVTELKATADKFRVFGAEADQIKAQKKINAKIKRDRELQERTDIIKAIQRAREGDRAAETFTPEVRARLDDIADDLKEVDRVENETEKRQLQIALLQEGMGLVSAEDQNKALKFLRPFAPNAFAEFLSQ